MLLHLLAPTRPTLGYSPNQSTQFAEWEFPLHPILQVSMRCAISCALEADPLQRSPGQPAVSQKRDQNNLRVFVINIAAGGGKPSKRATAAEQSAAAPAEAGAELALLLLKEPQ